MESVFFLNREEAISLLKEIIGVCSVLSGEAIMLMPANADDVLSHGYQLHIKAMLSQHDLSCIKPIVEKHNLSIANEPNKNLLVIYRPL